MMALDFTDRQARTIAAAITTVSGLVILVAIGLLGWLAALFLRTFSGVFLPLAVGAVGALVCRPYYQWLRTTGRMPVAVAMAAVFLSALVPGGIFAAVFGQLAVAQLIELAAQAPAWWENGRTWVTEQLPRATEMLDRSGLSERLSQAVTAQQAAILQWLQAIGSQAMTAGFGVARGIGALFSWVITPSTSPTS